MNNYLWFALTQDGKLHKLYNQDNYENAHGETLINFDKHTKTIKLPIMFIKQNEIKIWEE